MPLNIRQIPESEVPKPGRTGKINEDLVAVRTKMQNLASDMVLEIEAGSENAVRGAKTLVTRAAEDLGARWQHWNVGSKVFARPAEPVRPRRGRRRPMARG